MVARWNDGITNPTKQWDFTWPALEEVASLGNIPQLSTAEMLTAMTINGQTEHVLPHCTKHSNDQQQIVGGSPKDVKLRTAYFRAMSQSRSRC